VLHRCIAVFGLLGLLTVAGVLHAQAAGKGYLGISTESTPPGARPAGAVVRVVEPDSPAAKAGIQPGDVIVRVNGDDVKNATILTGILRDRKPGDQLSVVLVRAGKELTVPVTLTDRSTAALPGEEPKPAKPEKPRDAERPRRPAEVEVPNIPLIPVEPQRRTAYLGVMTQELTPDLKKEFGVAVDQGVVVTDVIPNSAAERAGLQQGDVIVTVNGKPVASHEELRDMIRDMRPNQEIRLDVVRGKEKRTVKARLGRNPLALNPLLPIQPFDEDLFPFVFPMIEDAGRVRELEQKIRELEKKIQELEKQLQERPKQ
jgi:serine protease Do